MKIVIFFWYLLGFLVIFPEGQNWDMAQFCILQAIFWTAIEILDKK